MTVWMLAAVRTGQIAIVLILTYTVGLGDLTHIIAGSVEALYLVWPEGYWFACAGGYMLPTDRQCPGRCVAGGGGKPRQVVAGSEQT